MRAGLSIVKGLQRLELYAGKLARTVLRGGAASNGRFLPDSQPYPDTQKPRLSNQAGLFIVCGFREAPCSGR